MRKLLAAFVALTADAALVVLGLPAAAAGPRSFTANSKTVRAGQQIKVSGKGCGSQPSSASISTTSRSTTTAPTGPASSSTTSRSRPRWTSARPS
jgi:hypothetical protein